jgi:hypothetical protein
MSEKVCWRLTSSDRSAFITERLRSVADELTHFASEIEQLATPPSPLADHHQADVGGSARLYLRAEQAAARCGARAGNTRRWRITGARLLRGT